MNDINLFCSEIAHKELREFSEKDNLVYLDYAYANVEEYMQNHLIESRIHPGLNSYYGVSDDDFLGDCI